MELLKEITNIESRCYRNIDWYYRKIGASSNFKNILTNGLQCSALTKESINDNGGKYYISLCKDRMTGNVADLYYLWSKDIMFVINDIIALKCLESGKLDILNKTIFGIRFSSFSDEYQVFYQINPKNIIGLQCNLQEWSYGKTEGFLEKLDRVETLVNIMDEEGVNLPIYDNSNADELTTYEIDKEGILALSRKIK